MHDGPRSDPRAVVVSAALRGGGCANDRPARAAAPIAET